MAAPLTDITGIGPAAVQPLMDHGFKTIESLADTTVEKLSAVSGFSITRSQKTIDAAKKLLATADAGTTVSVKKSASQKTDEKKPTPKNKKSKKNKKNKKDKKGKKNKDKGKEKKKNKSKKK